MGSGNEPEDMTVAYMMGKLDALDDVKELRDRISELEAELEKRPVVYCARNKSTGLMLTLGGHVVIMHEVQRSAWEDSDWTTEVYTGGQQS